MISLMMAGMLLIVVGLFSYRPCVAGELDDVLHRIMRLETVVGAGISYSVQQSTYADLKVAIARYERSSEAKTELLDLMVEVMEQYGKLIRCVACNAICDSPGYATKAYATSDELEKKVKDYRKLGVIRKRQKGVHHTMRHVVALQDGWKGKKT